MEKTKFNIVCFVGIGLGLTGFVAFLINHFTLDNITIELISILLVVISGICSVISFILFKGILKDTKK